MSARSTTTFSLAQMYCCLSREPQAWCNRLNEMPAEDWVAEKSFTGTETRPKVTVREAIERAAMVNSLSTLGPHVPGFEGAEHLPRKVEDPGQVVPCCEDPLPRVAIMAQAFDHCRQPKMTGFGRRQLVPGQGRRHPGARYAARRIRSIQGAAAAVHVVVEEDLAGALLDRPIHRDLLRVLAHQMLADQLADVARLLG